MSVNKKSSTKNKTKVVSSKKLVKKKPIAKKKTKTPLKKVKKTLAKKPVEKNEVSQKTVLKQSEKKAVKESIKKPKQKSIKKGEAKTLVQTSSYLSGLEQELERILEKNRQVSIKGSEGFEYCFEENCDQPSTTGGYCRYHYMVSWHSIKKKNKILSENKLKSWTLELIQNYSPRILDYMVRDLSNEKDFATALSEMKLVSKKPAGY